MNLSFNKITAIAFTILLGPINVTNAQFPTNKNINSISGVVINSKNDEPVEFATLTIKGASVGTVANDKGVFCLEATKSIGITLLVSCMGYEPLEIKISETNYTKPNIFKLNPAEYTIQEVTIKSKHIRAKDMVKMIVARIPQNYFAKQQENYIFERTISRDSTMEGFLMEEISLRTPQVKLKARAARRRFTNVTNKELSWEAIDHPFSGWGSLNIFVSDKMFFKSKRFGKWNFCFAPSPSDTIIAISFKQKNQPMNFSTLNGIMYVNRKDLAIVKINYNYNMLLAKSYSTVYYKKQEGQYVLFYMQTEDKGENPFNGKDMGIPFGRYTIRYEYYCINIVSNDADSESLVKVINDLKKHPNEWNIPNLPIVSIEQN